MTYLELQNEIYDLNHEITHFYKLLELLNSSHEYNLPEHLPSLLHSFEALYRPIKIKSEYLVEEIILKGNMPIDD